MSETSNSNINGNINIDQYTFNQIFDKYYHSLCFFCNGYVKDLDMARSLVQQIFVELWVKKDHLNIKYSIKSYLYNAVKNKAIDYIRQQKHTTHITEYIIDLKEVPFHDLIQEAEILEQINKSINQLPDKCKEVFLLCRFEGMKYREIADKLNISIKTVEMQMGIALKRLRSKLPNNKAVNFFIAFYSNKNQD